MYRHTGDCEDGEVSLSKCAINSESCATGNLRH